MALTTSKAGRLIAYTNRELLAYTNRQLNSLPYGINRAFAAAEASAASRGEKIRNAQAEAERVDIVAYSALGVAVDNLEAAANELLASFS